MAHKAYLPTEPLEAPQHLTGRFTRHRPQHLIEERQAWAAKAGLRGYSSYQVAEALGISDFAARRCMKQGGWNWVNCEYREKFK